MTAIIWAQKKMPKYEKHNKTRYLNSNKSLVSNFFLFFHYKNRKTIKQSKKIKTFCPFYKNRDLAMNITIKVSQSLTQRVNKNNEMLFLSVGVSAAHERSD